ncbi:MAG: aminotransferase class III-fold pyridoxal phosphate-dependent enzyme, partial [Saccharothrix sp.]|nr:aminotransferase class III-fold pyridoxal phosphate-dependent enzyme [Saccharothrix sp.]
TAHGLGAHAAHCAFGDGDLRAVARALADGVALPDAPPIPRSSTGHGRRFPVTALEPEPRDSLLAVARLWSAGASVSWEAVCPGQRTARLPHYPFQRRRLWLAGAIEPGPPPGPGDADSAGAQMSQVLESVRGVLAELLDLPPEEVDADLPLLELGADSPAYVDLVRRVSTDYGVRLSVRQLFEELTTARLIADHIATTAHPTPPPDPTPAAASPAAAGPVAPAPAAPVAPAAASPAVASSVAPAVASPAVASPAVASSVAPAAAVPVPAAPVVQAPAAPGTLAAQVPAAQVPVAPVVPVAVAQSPAGPASVAPVPVASRAAVPVADGTSPVAPPRRTWSGREEYFRELVERHHRRTPTSLARAREHQDGLTNNRRSAVGLHQATAPVRYPVVGSRSAGGRLWDVDGNEYVDLAMGFGAHLFGHSPDFVVRALREQLDRGIHLGPEAELGGAVAAKVRALTGVERVNFCTSGTEAVMTAIRIARAATGRSTIVVFANAYHGHFDGTLVNRRLGDSDFRAAPMASGVVESMVSDVVVLPFNRPESVRYLAEHGDRIAAVVTEPVQNRNPGEHAGPFLRDLRRVTAEHGVVLVFDEVLTGFRVHPAGGQGWFGVTADLVTYGKTLAGGLPMAAVAGRRDLLDLVDGGTWFGPSRLPEGTEPTYTAGTYVKHPLALAAADAVLGRLLDAGPGLQEDLNGRAAELVDAVNDEMTALSVPVSVARFGSFFRVVGKGNFSFVHQPVEVEMLRVALGHHGVFLVETGSCFLSTAHTAADVDQVHRAFVAAVTEMRDARVWEREPARVTGPTPPVHADDPTPAPRALPALSLSYFGDGRGIDVRQHYDLVFDGASFADEAGLAAIWLPERHFHSLGGFSPNPSVLAAALARQTSRLELRAGSVVLPLHHPARVAEEWAVVDALSAGRVGLAFASGWNDQDFVLAPAGFPSRKADTIRAMGQVRALWRGESVGFPGADGQEVVVRTFPRPTRSELPVWLTALSSEDTFVAAGEHGVGVLTNLLNQDVAALGAKIALYRDARRRAGHDPSTGHVAVLLHTLLGEDRDAVRAAAREPLRGYLRAAADLSARMTDSNRRVDLDSLSPQDQDFLIDAALHRYADARSLIGTPADGLPLLSALASAGVDEVACFVDFGAPPELVRSGFAGLAALTTAGPTAEPTAEATAEPRSGTERVVVGRPPVRLVPELVAERLAEALAAPDDDPPGAGLSTRMVAHRV